MAKELLQQKVRDVVRGRWDGGRGINCVVVQTKVNSNFNSKCEKSEERTFRIVCELKSASRIPIHPKTTPLHLYLYLSPSLTIRLSHLLTCHSSLSFLQQSWALGIASDFYINEHVFIYKCFSPLFFRFFTVFIVFFFLFLLLLFPLLFSILFYSALFFCFHFI